MTLRQRFHAALTTLALLAAGSQLARAAEIPPAVLLEVPDNAQVVVVIKDINGLATKISTLATRLNLTVPQDLIGLVTKNIGVREGLDKGGSMALVLLPPPPAGKDDDAGAVPPPEPLIVLPTTDAKAMLATFKPLPPEKGVSEVTMPNDPAEKGYVAVVGKFVVFGEEREHVQDFVAKKGPLKLTDEVIRTINANDLAIYANIPEINKAYGKKVDDTLQYAAMMMDIARGGQDQTANSIMEKEMANMVFGGIRDFFKDAESSLLTARLSDTGLTFGASGTFKADSSWGKMVAATRPAREISLHGLPGEGTVWCAGTMNLEGSGFSGMITTMMERTIANPAMQDDDKKADLEKLKKNLAQQKKTAGLITGMEFAAYSPENPDKTGWAQAAVLIETPDAQKYFDLAIQGAKENAETVNEVVKSSITVKENAATVDGVKVARIIVKMSATEDSPAADMALKVFNLIGSPEGLVVHMAVVDKRVVMTMGGDAKFVESVIAAAKKDGNGLGENKDIASVQAEVLKSPSMVFYLPVDRWVSAVRGHKDAATGTAPQAGGNPAQSPVVISTNVEGQTGRFEIFIPMGTMSTAVETWKSFGQKMMEGTGDDAAP